MFAKHDFEVVGVDINHDIIAQLNHGQVHIQEDGLSELVQDVLSRGKLRVSAHAEAADAFLIAVPTPFFDNKSADMRAVVSATEAILPYLQKGNLVILESTSPPRTTVDLVRPILERSGLKAGTDFHLAYSPERVLPGKIIQELVNNARVIGGIDRESAEAAGNLYRTFVQGEIILTDATTAEMVKLMENTYRDINIAIANEFSRLAERFGINVWEAIKIANLHPRVKILDPGPGVGGHCISVDPWFLVEAAPDITPLVRTAREVNDAQPHFVVKLIERALGEIKGKRITLLGLAFKPNVDDLRESPAVEVAHLLANKGARVTAYEPYRPSASYDEFATVESLEMAVREAEAIVLMVKHDLFRQIMPAELTRLTKASILVDTVNGWDQARWAGTQFQVFSLGSGK
jgi:UDP-N-acetyl-D-mannosaminuronic acid dehydrogenase